MARIPDGVTARSGERGMALILVLLLLVLSTAMLAGFAALVVSDQRMRGVDRTRAEAFYGAQAGLERLTADLGNLFSSNYAPTAEQITALTATPPSLPGISFTAPDGSSGYAVQFTTADGAPAAQNLSIASGPFQGFIALTTPYTLDITARALDGSEARLQRTMQTVSIPIFQFGIFSDTDVSFFAGPTFGFGGRVHTNGNLFLASGDGSTLTMSDRVTAVGEVIRTHLSNGWANTSNYEGTVRVARAPGAYRNLAMTEGSLRTTLGSAQNEPTWTNLFGTYNGYLRNGRTGARQLNLPFVTLGATPIDLIRRGVPGENSLILEQRYFSMASLRILLSDTATELTGLPTVTGTPPVPLTTLAAAQAAGYAGVPLALSMGHPNPGYETPVDTPLLGGFIKIEMQRQDRTWQDVTTEIVNLGIAGRALPVAGAIPAGPFCTEPAPDAILRLQRIKDAPAFAAAAPVPAGCGNGSPNATDYIPMTLYDTREGDLRDDQPTGAATIFLGGVMHYVELDVRNLSRWLQGQIGASGIDALNETGYVVYFSDRRTNQDNGVSTGAYGFEDNVNPAVASGLPNGSLDAGEDVNANGRLDTYGQTPIRPSGAGAPLDAAARPWTSATGAVQVTAAVAKNNPAIFFRRALKLTNGALGNIVAPGLTIAAENPVYVQGHYNANGGGFGNPHVAAAVIGDAVTLLSGNWNDNASFRWPQDPGRRDATTTWYRMAVISGKGPSFPHPGGTAQDFGTDGGVHNFLRYLEDWGGRTLNYRGAIASLYFNRQAVGTYKCCTNVYNPPTRAYAFDTDFLTPSLLPPRTPMFRDVNTTGFTQVIR